MQGKTFDDFETQGGWDNDASTDMNAANRLSIISLQLPKLKMEAQTLIARGNASVEDLVDTANRARVLDGQLAAWERSLPTCWRSRRIKITDPTVGSDAELWNRTMDVYDEVAFTNTLGEYRLTRIFSQAIISGCIAAIPEAMRSVEINQMNDESERICQEMADDFCYGLPFQLGVSNNLKGNAASPSSTELGPQATGVFFAVFPLIIISKLPRLPEAQRAWLSSRLGHLMHKFVFLEDGKV
jgi:hypothetical protein